MDTFGVRAFFSRMFSGRQMDDVMSDDTMGTLSSSDENLSHYYRNLWENQTTFPDLDDLTCYTASFSGGEANVDSTAGSLTLDSPDGSSLSKVLTTIKRIFRTDNNRTVTLAQIGFNNGGQAGSSKINGSLHYCNRTWDRLICWPEILEGHSVTVPCFSSFNQIPYDTSRTVTRACEEGGIWEEKTNYTNCVPLQSPPEPSDSWILEITTWVYFTGYCLSITALILAVSIFIALKELRCLRNTIHTHLMLTYISADALWLITSQSHIASNSQASCVTFILLHYFHLTNFFWMLVEGLYLYVLVVKTFTAENIKLRTYVFIGWGVPFIVVVGWSIVKYFTQGPSADMQATMADPELNPMCLWLTVNLYDWIYKSPAICVLAANILFLMRIMWVLITKLRSATNPETQQSRKAAKALVVLMPLLGITYVLILTGSKSPLYEHMRALLISTQGFLVALLYCCMNGEVRQAIRHRWNRWGGSELVCCKYFQRRRGGEAHHHRDWSLPRSRTESIRLYSCPQNNASLCQNSQHNHFSRGRMASTTSEATTLTNLTNSNSIQQFGGNVRGGTVSRPLSMLSADSSNSGRGRNGFDQLLLSPTITSISAALTVNPAEELEQGNHNDGNIDHSGLMQSNNSRGNVGDLSDVAFIDSYEGQVYGA